MVPICQSCCYVRILTSNFTCFVIFVNYFYWEIKSKIIDHLKNMFYAKSEHTENPTYTLFPLRHKLEYDWEPRQCSSTGSVLAWHTGGQRFESSKGELFILNSKFGYNSGWRFGIWLIWYTKTLSILEWEDCNTRKNLVN